MSAGNLKGCRRMRWGGGGRNDIWWRKFTRCESANGSLIKCEMICLQRFRVTTAERETVVDGPSKAQINYISLSSHPCFQKDRDEIRTSLTNTLEHAFINSVVCLTIGP